MSPKKYEVRICLSDKYIHACFSANCSASLLSLQGGREVSDFISYLKREASNPLVMQDEAKKKKKKKDDDKSEL